MMVCELTFDFFNIIFLYSSVLVQVLLVVHAAQIPHHFINSVKTQSAVVAVGDIAFTKPVQVKKYMDRKKGYLERIFSM